MLIRICHELAVLRNEVGDLSDELGVLRTRDWEAFARALPE